MLLMSGSIERAPRLLFSETETCSSFEIEAVMYRLPWIILSTFVMQRRHGSGLFLHHKRRVLRPAASLPLCHGSKSPLGRL